MKTCNFTEKEFKNLEQFNVPNGIINTEGTFYVIKKNNGKNLLKRYFVTEGKNFSNKLLTISMLIENGESLGIDKLVLPTELAMVDDKVVGHIMPFIENNENIEPVLRNTSVSFEKKKELLMKIGKLVTKAIHNYPRTGFLFGDLHESNFILNKDDNEVYAVDLDGCKIGNNKMSGMRYCDCRYDLRCMPKKYTQDSDGFVVPSINAELFCYTYMVLNTIAGTSVTFMTTEMVYEYLDYLKDNGLDSELIDIFANLYKAKDNYFPLEVLDTIPNDMGKYSYKVYMCRRKKK